MASIKDNVLLCELTPRYCAMAQFMVEFLTAKFATNTIMKCSFYEEFNSQSGNTEVRVSCPYPIPKEFLRKLTNTEELSLGAVLNTTSAKSLKKELEPEINVKELVATAVPLS